MSEQDYKELLKRARNDLPKSIILHSRFTIPEVDVLYEGNTTVLRNFNEVANKLNREPQQILAYLLKELGTAGNFDGKRVIFKGRVLFKNIQDRIREYARVFVLCSECEKPDTHLEKEGRTLVLRCHACGAHRPVKAHKAAKSPTLFEIREGDIFNVTITDIGRKGDGIAKLDKYTIYVPGTAKGSNVKIKLEKIVGNICFARIIK